MTTPSIRYHITDDLWASFTVEQVNKQIDRLISTGRYRLPNNGAYTVRLACGTLYGNPGMNEDDWQEFDDFDFQGAECVAARATLRRRANPNISLERRHEILKAQEAKYPNQGPYWWEGNFVCNQSHVTIDKETLALMPLVAKVLIVMLHDRMTHKVEVEPSKPSKLHKLGIGKKRPDVPDDAAEIMLTIPRRAYTGDHGGTHASPRTHYRAEHVRQQPTGSRANPVYKEIVIEGGWINKGDFDPGEPLTPIRRAYKLVKAS